MAQAATEGRPAAKSIPVFFAGGGREGGGWIGGSGVEEERKRAGVSFFPLVCSEREEKELETTRR